MEMNKIINGDSLKIMPMIPDKTFDLLILDWPYNIKKAEWDKIPNYLEWCGTVLKEHERMLKDNGSLYIFHNDFNIITSIKNWITQNTLLIFKQFILWDKIGDKFKNKGFANQRMAIESMRNYYNGFAEYILFYTFQDETGLETITDKYIKPKNPFSIYLRSEFQKANISNLEIAKLFPSKTGGLTGCVSNWLNGDNVITKEQYLKIRNHINNGKLVYLRREYEDLRREYEDLRYTFNVQNANYDIKCNSTCWQYEPMTSGEHETQKPEQLIENIVLHSSNENDLVGDFFAGTGMTGAVCKLNKRNYFLVEKEQKYFEKIERRIRLTAKQEALNLH